MPENQEYKPSASGKVSAGIAASISGYAAYKTHIFNRYPNPAQTPIKVPVSGNISPRSAGASIGSSLSFYSAQSKASITIRNLEASYRMRGSTWRGGRGADSAPAIAGILSSVISPIINPPILNGLVSVARRFDGVSAPEEAAMRWAIKTGEVKDISSAIAYLERFRANQKQLGLLHVPDSSPKILLDVR